MERSTIFNGKIHYKWAIFNSYVKLPEGKSPLSQSYLDYLVYWKYEWGTNWPFGPTKKTKL